MRGKAGRTAASGKQILPDRNAGKQTHGAVQQVLPAGRLHAVRGEEQGAPGHGAGYSEAEGKAPEEGYARTLQGTVARREGVTGAG